MVIGGHTAYWCPRAICYFETFPFIAALIARGILHMSSRGRILRWTGGGILVLIIGSVALGVLPWASESRAPARAVRDAIERTRRVAEPLLVFIEPLAGRLGHELEEQVRVLPGSDGLSSGLFNYSLSPDEPVIYAVDRGPDNRLLVDAFRARKAYLLRGSRSEQQRGPLPFRPVLVPLGAQPPNGQDVAEPRIEQSPTLRPGEPHQ